MFYFVQINGRENISCQSLNEAIDERDDQIGAGNTAKIYRTEEGALNRLTLPSDAVEVK